MVGPPRPGEFRARRRREACTLGSPLGARRVRSRSHPYMEPPAETFREIRGPYSCGAGRRQKSSSPATRAMTARRPLGFRNPKS